MRKVEKCDTNREKDKNRFYAPVAPHIAALETDKKRLEKSN